MPNRFEQFARPQNAPQNRFSKFAERTGDDPRARKEDRLPRQNGSFLDPLVGQGLLMGFGDEIKAGVRAGVQAPFRDETFGELYESELGRNRSNLEAYRERNPVTSTMAEMGGAAATAFVPGGMAARGLTLGQRAVQGAKAGAGYGAAYGAGTGEGASDRAVGAGIGAVTGGAVGAAVPPVVAGAQAVGRGARAGYDRATGTARGALAADKEAARIVSRGIQEDRRLGQAGLSEAELQAAQQGGQPAVVADMGGRVTGRIARSAANTSPEGGAALGRTAQDRFASQNERVTGFVRRLVGGTDATTTRETLETAARRANRPAYARAYQKGDQGIITPEIERLTSAPVMIEAMRTAATKGKSRAVSEGFGAFNPAVKVTPDGQVIFQRGKGGAPTYPNLQFWDYTKRELDDMARAVDRAGRGGEASTIRDLARGLRAELDQVVPEYRQAREGAAAFFDAEDALEAGEKFVMSNKPLGEAGRALQKMKPPERELFREGFASSLIDRVNKASDSRDVVKQIFGSPQSRQKITMALGPQKAKELEAFLHVESVMDRLRGAVSGNSTTARQLVELGIAGGTGGYSAYTGDPTAMGIGMAVLAGAFAKRGIDRRVSERVARLLVSDDPQQLQRGMKIVLRQDKMLEALRRLDLPASAAGAQQATGAAQDKVLRVEPDSFRMAPPTLAR